MSDAEDERILRKFDVVLRTDAATQDIVRTINAMLTAALTDGGRPSDILADSLPADAEAAWHFTGQVVNGLAGLLAGRMQAHMTDPLQAVQYMARFTEGLGFADE